MIRALHTYLIRRRFKKMEQELRFAQAALAPAAFDYEYAKRRGDTRRQHETFCAYSRAKHAVVKAEVALSMCRSQHERSRAKRPAGRLVPQ